MSNSHSFPNENWYKLIINNLQKQQMHSFLYIAKQTVRNSDNMIEKIIFMMINNEYTIQDKFDFFNTNMTNCFYNSEIREHFLTTFCNIQKTYFAFSRLSRIFKLKFCKFVVTTDLCMNELSIKDKNVMYISQGNKNYLFAIRDLINLIETALLNHYCFFSLPLCVKNPYNNLPFDKSTLYNIYYFIRFNTYLYPDLFFRFFNSNFNLKVFGRKYDYLLREMSIQKYVENTDTDILHSDIKDMIEIIFIQTRHKILIHKDFPKKRLVEIFRPYLHLWYLSFYSLIQTKREESIKRLTMKLVMFAKFNPQFGRKYIQFTKVFINEKIERHQKVLYNDTHIPFVDSKSNFLSNHLHL
jgi:hypothetical protein